MNKPIHVRVVSDGDPFATKITDLDGNEIKNIRSASIWMDRDGVRVELEILVPVVDVQGRLEEVSFRCPACDENISHKCHGETLGGS